MVYALGAAIIGIVFIGAICGSPSKPGTVAGQVLGYTTDRTLTNLAGAQLTLTGEGQTYTTTSSEVPDGAEGEAAYNYRFDEVPPGDYKLSVKPPPGAAYQPEDDLTFKVRSGQLFPQSVMLLADGVQKPRALAQNELQPGEAGGYINDRGERVVYRQGGGFDASDALLMYLLWRNPPGWGYGAPPVIVRSPGGTSTSSYRVADPPTSTRNGQTVTQRKPETPGQGSTRPSSSTGVTGAGPNTSSSSSSSSSSSTQSRPSTGSSSSSSSGSRTGSSTITRPSAPSQGSTRPSSSFSSPSRSSAPSRSSGGGRR
ncbi:MAG: carboxypeptidase-like regulatory domain-containing protein [Chloroflexota bacterium]